MYYLAFYMLKQMNSKYTNIMAQVEYQRLTKFTRNMNMSVIDVSFFPEFTFLSYFQNNKTQCWLSCPVLGRS